MHLPCFLIALILTFEYATAYSEYSISRRIFFRDIAATSVAVMSVVDRNPLVANANDDEASLESVYCGVGCFWHLQHSIAVFERDQLGRKGGQLTCQTGYAGGKAAERVCYHNAEGIADYGALGHGEVVQVQVPKDRMLDLTQVYLNNFDINTKGK